MSSAKTLAALNIALFNQLDRLNDSEELPKEIERSKAVSAIARDIIANARLALEVEQHFATQNKLERKIPSMLESNDNE
jgi:hypothetical protein